MPLDVSRIKGICFDVDGTLSDTDNQMVESVYKVVKPLSLFFRNSNFQLFSRRLVMAVETPGNLLLSIPDILGLDDELMWMAEKLARWGRKEYHFLLIPQVMEMLNHLKTRYPLAVVSARNEHGTMHFLDQFNLAPFFKSIVTGQTCPRTKPFPDPIQHAADQMGLRPFQLLMVGDTTVDILAARRAGAQSVGVLCGFGEECELRRAGADLILEQTSDLLAYLPDSISQPQEEHHEAE